MPEFSQTLGTGDLDSQSVRRVEALEFPARPFVGDLLVRKALAERGIHLEWIDFDYGGVDNLRSNSGDLSENTGALILINPLRGEVRDQVVAVMIDLKTGVFYVGSLDFSTLDQPDLVCRYWAQLEPGFYGEVSLEVVSDSQGLKVVFKQLGLDVEHFWSGPRKPQLKIVVDADDSAERLTGTQRPDLSIYKKPMAVIGVDGRALPSPSGNPVVVKMAIATRPDGSVITNSDLSDDDYALYFGAKIDDLGNFRFEVPFALGSVIYLRMNPENEQTEVEVVEF